MVFWPKTIQRNGHGAWHRNISESGNFESEVETLSFYCNRSFSRGASSAPFDARFLSVKLIFGETKGQ